MRDKSNIPFSFLKYEHPTYYFQLFRKEVIFLFLIVKDNELLINKVVITAKKLQKRNVDFEWIIIRVVDRKEEERYYYLDTLSTEKLANKIMEVLTFPKAVSEYTHFVVQRIKENFSLDKQ